MDVRANIMNMDPRVILEQAFQEKEYGNFYYGQENYILALQMYSSALDKFTIFPSVQLVREIAMLLTNKSVCHRKLRIDDNALQDANAAINVDPTWHKGHWHKAQIFKEIKVFYKAFEAYLSGYNHSITSDDNKKNFLVEAVQLIPQVKDASQILKSRCSVPLEMWMKVVSQLLSPQKYHGLRYIFLGFDRAPALVDRSVSVKEFPLGQFLLICSDNDLHVWGQRLAVEMLRRGSQVKLVATKDSNVLQMCVDIGMRTGCCDLLVTCIDLDPSEFSRLLLTAQNQIGDTVLHRMTKSQFKNSQSFVEGFCKLLRGPVDPHIHNNEGKKAIYYLRPNDFIYKPLQHLMFVTGIGSEQEGQQKSYQNLMAMKLEGNEYMKCGDFIAAEQRYNVVIDKISSLKLSNARDLAVLHSNRAFTRMKQNNGTGAEQDARACIRCDPDWYKGHARLAAVLCMQGKHASGVECYVQAFKHVKMEATQEKKEVVEEILRVLRSNHEQLERYPNLKWCRIMEYLASVDRWSDLDFLVRSAERLGCSYGNISVPELCKMSVKEWHAWGEKLLIKAFKNGVSYNRLAPDRFGNPPLHMALRIFAETGGSNLLLYMLSTHDLDRINQIRDGKGGTLLHAAAKLSKQFKDVGGHQFLTVKPFRLLLQYKLNLMIEDFDKKIATEYLQSQHPAHTFMWTEMEKIHELQLKASDSQDKKAKARQAGCCEQCQELWDWVMFNSSHGNRHGAFRHLCSMLGRQVDDMEAHRKMMTRAAEKMSEYLDERKKKKVPTATLR